MIKYYTRACNFYYGSKAKLLVKKVKLYLYVVRKMLLLIQLEIFSRNQNKIKSKLINIKNVKNLNKQEKNKIKKDLKNITSKRKNFLKNVDFSDPTIMGILNLTPDSFSDGGKFNKNIKSFKHIDHMIKHGAKIIDIGAESTRPGSKEINSKVEFKRLERVLRSFKKK